MATKLEQRTAAERMAENERGSKGKATAQIPASSEQKRKLKELGLTGVLTVVPGGFILKGLKGAPKVYKTIDAARKAAEVANKNVSKDSKPTPQKGKAARLRNLSKPLLEKTLQPLTGTKTGPSKQSIKDQLKRVREIADKEKSGQLSFKQLKDNKKESFVPKGMSRKQKNPTTSRASEKGTGKRVGYSKKMERTGKILGRAERTMEGSGMGAIPMSATTKDKDKPKLAPRPKSKPVPKTKNKDTKEYSTTRRGLSGRNVQVPSNKKDANVIVDMDAIPKKSTGGSVSKKRKGFSGRGTGAALRGF